MGDTITNEIHENQSFGLTEILKNIKWKNTVVSERNSEILFIPKEKIIKNLFSNKLITNLTLNILKWLNNYFLASKLLLVVKGDYNVKISN